MPLPLPANAPGFRLLAKPRGPICNIDCACCYFVSNESLYLNDKQRMSMATLETHIRPLPEAHRTPQVAVAWLGGEPSRMKLLEPGCLKTTRSLCQH